MAARRQLKLPLFGKGVWHERVRDRKPVENSAARVIAMHGMVLRDMRGRTNATSNAWVNSKNYSVPIYPADTGPPSPILRFESYYGDKWEPHTALYEHDTDASGQPFAKNVRKPHGSVRTALPTGKDSDGHLVLLDEAEAVSTEFWHAWLDGKRSGGERGSEITATGGLGVFRLGPNATGSQFVEGERLDAARATGLSLLCGLLLPESFLGQCIPHALACSFPKLRNIDRHNPGSPGAGTTPNWFSPASRTEDGGSSVPDTWAVAGGERLRLADSVHDDRGTLIWERGEPKIPLPIGTQMFLTALYDYGFIAVDASVGWPFYAEAPETAASVTALRVKRIRELSGILGGADPGWMELIKAIRTSLIGNLSLATVVGNEQHANFEILMPA